MSLRENVFGSKAERRAYYNLRTIWKKYFNVWHNEPFANIFDIDSLDIDEKQRDFLLKTSIDYTICNKNDKPLMCIEYDGKSGGYSRRDEYIQIKNDPNRKTKLELKLKIANEHDFPFYIISFPEVKRLQENINLTIIDGIIGQSLAQKYFPDKIIEKLKSLQAEWQSRLNEEGLEEGEDIYLKELIWRASEIMRDSKNLTDLRNHRFLKNSDLAVLRDLEDETIEELELTWDPIAKKTKEIEDVLTDRGIILSPLNVIGPLFESAMRETKDFRNIERIGYEVFIATPVGEVRKKVWARDIASKFVSPLLFVFDITALLVYYEAAIVNGIKFPN